MSKNFKNKKTKKTFWQNSRPKTKNKTLSNTFETGGLKNVDINVKFTSLQFSWVKKKYNENFHEWNLIPFHLIFITFGQNFKFHPNLLYDAKLLASFPVFYKNILRYWTQHFTVSPELPSCHPVSYPLFYDTTKMLNQQQANIFETFFQ